MGCDTGLCNTAQKNITKAFSAHGNAQNNYGGGWDTTPGGTGNDGALNPTRGGSNMNSVQCFDCHSSHGSKLVGITSSYITDYGAEGVGQYGANLKETSAGKGGYSMSYKASSNPACSNPTYMTQSSCTANGGTWNSGVVNPYGAGAGQCFDCHETTTANTGSRPTPWGYQSTFGATAPIRGYKDTAYFGQGTKGSQTRFPYRANKTTILGGHLRAETSLITPAQHNINGLCTPCHDPHGVSPTLGANQAYGVPLLKGTWLTSPYKEDSPSMSSGVQGSRSNEYPATKALQTVNIDQNTFSNGAISETDTQFAGLCLNCHPKASLTDGVTHTWRDKNRIHESVKGWKTADSTIQHNYPCSKCHQPHNSGLPRLLQINCLDYNHRGQVASGGSPSNGSGPHDNGSFPKGSGGFEGSNCHPTPEGWPNNYWNTKTPW